MSLGDPPLDDVPPVDAPTPIGDAVDDALGDRIAVLLLLLRDGLHTIFKPLDDATLRAVAREYERRDGNWYEQVALVARSELGLRRGIRRAKELGAEVYCFHHDCDMKNCPPDFHRDNDDEDGERPRTASVDSV